MIARTTLRGLLALTASTIGVLLASGCSDDTTGPSNSTRGTVYFEVAPATAVIAAKAEGDVVLTRARFLLRRIVFKDATEQEVDVATSPRIVELSLQGERNDISVQSIPFGTYDEVRFDVHRLDDDDPADQAVLRQAEFADFAGPERPSMIFEGTYDDGTGPRSFVFHGTANDRQDVSLATPLQIDADNRSVIVTLSIDTSGWFTGPSGERLDPRDSQVENEISDNVRTSIDIFRDDDRDGEHD